MQSLCGYMLCLISSFGFKCTLFKWRMKVLCGAPLCSCESAQKYFTIFSFWQLGQWKEKENGYGVPAVLFLLSNRWQQSVTDNGAAGSYNCNERRVTL